MGKRVIVVGGGIVAARRIDSLAPGTQVVVVSRRICDDMFASVKNEGDAALVEPCADRLHQIHRLWKEVEPPSDEGC